MRGGHYAAPRLVILLTAGLAAALSLACAIPALSRGNAAPEVAATPPMLSPSPTQPPAPAPQAMETTIRIGASELNDWLQGMSPSLGQGAEFSDMRVTIRSTGITVWGNAKVAQLRGTQVPVEVLLMPVVRNDGLQLEVLDVRLGGAYASLSGLVKPLVVSGIDQGLDINALLADQGVHVTRVELQDGCLAICTVPAN